MCIRIGVWCSLNTTEKRPRRGTTSLNLPLSPVRLLETSVFHTRKIERPPAGEDWWVGVALLSAHSSSKWGCSHARNRGLLGAPLCPLAVSCLLVVLVRAADNARLVVSCVLLRVNPVKQNEPGALEKTV